MLCALQPRDRLRCLAAHACRAPSITAAAIGVHGINISVTPPADPLDIGAPYDYYRVKLCIAAAQPAICFTRDCDAAAGNAAFVCTIADAANTCFPDSVNCLRANTAYTEEAEGVNVDGVHTLPSNQPTFVTPNHACVSVEGQAPRACCRLLRLLNGQGRRTTALPAALACLPAAALSWRRRLH